MRIASINFYAVNRQAREDLNRIQNDLQPDVVGFQELIRHLGLAEDTLTNYRLLNARRDDTAASNEVTVGVRNRLTVRGWYALHVSQVTQESETRVFKNRWATVVKFLWKGQRWAILNYHGNALIQDRSTGDPLENERVLEYRRAAIEIETHIKSLQQEGFRVIVTGDFNYRRYSLRGFVLWYYSPQAIFERCNLSYAEKGLDYVAWPSCFNSVKQTLVPISQTGSDHPWLVVDIDA